MASKKKGGTKANDLYAADLSPLENRVALFFRSQRYGEAMGQADLALDLSDEEVKELVSGEEKDAILADMEKAGFKLPEKAADRAQAARAKAVEKAIESLVKAGVLTRIEMDEPGKVGLGYYYSAKRSPNRKTGDVKMVPLSSLIVKETLQARAGGINEKKVADYTEVADQLPAGRAFRVEGKDYVTEGFHRLKAWANAGFDMVPMEIINGTIEEAKLDAIGANAEHGFARTGDDIKRACGMFLAMPGKKNSSIAAVADAVKCSWATADRYVKALKREAGESPTKPKTVTNKRGKEQKVQSGGKAKTDTDAPASDQPADTAPPSPADTGVVDKLGNPVPAELVPAFTDTRFQDALQNVYQNLNYLREFRADGYSVSSLTVKEVAGLVGDVEFKLDTLQQSAPHAVCPSDAAAVLPELKAAVRRKWLNVAEWLAYNKATKGKKAAEPALTLSPESQGDNQQAQPEQPADAPATAA